MKTAQINIAVNTSQAISNIAELESEFNGVLSTIQDLKLASSTLSAELEATPVGTAKYEELKKALIDVNTQIKNYELSIEALDNEQLASEIKSVVGGLTDMAGGLALIGVSGKGMEEIAKTFAKIEGASRLVTGAMEVYSSGMKVANSVVALAATAHAANATAITAEGNASIFTTAKMRILNLVMNANPAILLVSAIAALAGAMYLFSDSTDDAAASQEEFNKEVERSNALAETRLKLTKSNADEITAATNAQLEITKSNIEEEIGLLEGKDNKTKTDLDNLLQYKKDLVKTEFDIYTNLAVGKNELIDAEIAAIKVRNETIKKQIGLLDENDEADLEKILSYNQKIYDNTASIILLQREKANVTTEGAIEVAKNETTLALLQAETAKKKADLDKADAEAKKRRDLDDRKALLDKIKEELARTEDAENKLEKLATSRISNLEQKELALQEIKFGDQLDDLIDRANQREIKAAEDKFLALGLTETEFFAERERITQAGVANLLPEELKLYDALFIENTKVIEDIKKTYADKAILATTAAAQINERLLLSEIEYQKKFDLIQNEFESNGLIRANSKYVIRTRFIDKEKELVISQYDAEKKLLEDNLKNFQGTQEEKVVLAAKTAEDLIQLERDKDDAIQAIQVESAAALMDKMVEKWNTVGDWIAAISTQITAALNDLQMFFDLQAAATAARLLDENAAIAEGLKAQYANAALTKQQYDEQVALLEQKKYHEEQAARRKAFAQNKAMSIANATMAGAQATISAFNAGASLGPAGLVAGPVFAGVAAALAAVQIGLIAAQKYKAARGGIVPGNNSKMDSVDALLAPGETVINSTSSTMFPQLLSEINKAGGGVALAPSMAGINTSSSNYIYGGASGNQSVRAYVVESDISSSQRRVNRLEASSRF